MIDARRLAWLASGILALAVLALAWRLGQGVAGLAYLGAWVLATVPGWPLGWRLFGARHAGGWIAGALLGYVLSAWSVWAATSLGFTSPGGRTVAWLLLTAALWAWLARRRPPLVTLPAWTSRDTVALTLVLALVPLLVWRPFARVGERDAAGTRYYRAYFTADVVWHVALTTELRRFTPPPRNPYTADRPLHYYWTYFQVPAAITTAAPRTFGDDPLPWLLINATGAGVLFFAVVFLFAWTAVPRAGLAAVSTALVALCASAEGSYFAWRLWWTGGPLDALRDNNIDAVTRLVFDGLTIDNLPRSLWYTPQHAGACALGLVALTVAAAGGPAAPVGARAIAGLALGAALTISPLLGGMFAVIYGLSLVVAAIGLPWRDAARAILGQTVAVVPAALAAGALIAAGMVEGAGNALHIGFVGYARHHPVGTLALALGPALVCALPALVWVLPCRQTREERVRLLPAATALGVGVLLFYFASLPHRDPIWVGWRAGQIMLVALPGLVAAAMAWGLTLRVWPLVPAAIGLAAAIGLPTTAIDTFNAQDIENRHMGAGFRLSVDVSAAEQDALLWLRLVTPPTSIVQVDVAARGSDSWTLLPTFAQRRMYAGLPISLLAEPVYRQRAAAVAAAFDTTDVDDAHRIFRAGHVHYVYVGDAERRAHRPEALAKFDQRPDAFRRVFDNAAATIYEVR
ncbi:MAG: hypothetical protein ABIT71_09905 [Vicinamibacteraceae bacterium]